MDNSRRVSDDTLKEDQIPYARRLEGATHKVSPCPCHGHYAQVRWTYGRLFEASLPFILRLSLRKPTSLFSTRSELALGWETVQTNHVVAPN
jgi:hypothetical protein